MSRLGIAVVAALVIGACARTTAPANAERTIFPVTVHARETVSRIDITDWQFQQNGYPRVRDDVHRSVCIGVRRDAGRSRGARGRAASLTQRAVRFPHGGRFLSRSLRGGASLTRGVGRSGASCFVIRSRGRFRRPAPFQGTGQVFESLRATEPRRCWFLTRSVFCPSRFSL